MNGSKKCYPNFQPQGNGGNSHGNDKKNKGYRPRGSCGGRAYSKNPCVDCGKRQRHHIVPDWIQRNLAENGMSVRNIDTTTYALCPKKHEEIEVINASFSRAVKILYGNEFTELIQLYRAGEEIFTEEELNTLANHGTLKGIYVTEFRTKLTPGERRRPNAHKLRNLLWAVIMRRYQEQYWEIFRLFLKGKNIFTQNEIGIYAKEEHSRKTRFSMNENPIEKRRWKARRAN